MTFWEHLDELRAYLWRAVVAVAVAAAAVFCFKDLLFYCVLAPSHSSFVTYRLFSMLTGVEQCFESRLFNPQLTQQFFVHMKMSVWVGFMLVSPYVLYLLFRFVSPALYRNEHHYALRAVTGGYVMFLLGVAVGYFLIFPFTFHFLASYQVDAAVPNIIALSDYVSMLLVVCILMGTLFEMPVMCWMLAKMNVLDHRWMARYRRHAVVLVLIVAAVITPTGDAFTLILVSLPVYLLYEFSIFVVKHA